MREYEFVFIVKATESDETIGALIDQLSEVARSRSGEVVKVEKWGRRKLAYEIKKQREGFYVLLLLLAGPEVVTEIERQVKLNDAVLRFLTVRVDQETRRAHRREVMRAKKKGTEAPAERPPFGRKRLDIDVQTDESAAGEGGSQSADGSETTGAADDETAQSSVDAEADSAAVELESSADSTEEN